MQWWTDHPIAAGRDLEAGGTWLGVNKSGRFAAVTNYREVKPHENDSIDLKSHAPKKDDLESRGALVKDILASHEPLDQLKSEIEKRQDHFAGYNLLFGDLFGEQHQLYFTSNRTAKSFKVEPGVYAFSNGPFESQWPKSATVRQNLTRALRHRQPQEFWSILANQERPDPSTLPDTGVGAELEEFLSSIFIVGDEYGTRSSNLLLCRSHRELDISERRFDVRGDLTGVSHIKIKE